MTIRVSSHHSDHDPSPSLPALTVVVPAYNEGTTIEALLTEILIELQPLVRPTIIVCADPGSDDTLEIVHRLSERMPLIVDSSGLRRGYVRSVLDGLARVDSDYALVLDGDGQCDPRDFPRLWMQRAADLVIGQRVPRRDPATRRVISTGFRYIYRATLGVTVRDPSCPYLLLRLDPMRAILAQIGTMTSGIWWELVARAHWHGRTIVEVPVRHRPRPCGPSRALPTSRLVGASVDQLRELLRLRQELHAPAASS